MSPGSARRISASSIMLRKTLFLTLTAAGFACNDSSRDATAAASSTGTTEPGSSSYVAPTTALGTSTEPFGTSTEVSGSANTSVASTGIGPGIPLICPSPTGTGAPLDAHGFAGPRYQEFGPVAVGPDDLLHVVGTVDFAGQCEGLVPDPAPIDFGGPPLFYPHDDDQDFAILRYDLRKTYSEGHLAGHLFTGPGYQNAYALAVDAAGNLYAVGRFNGYLTLPQQLGGTEPAATLFGPPPDLTGYPSHAFVFAYDAGGNYLWHDQLGDDKLEAFLYSVAVDASGDVWVAGKIEGEHELGPACAAASTWTPFVARYGPIADQPAEPKWIRCADNGGSLSEAYAIALDPEGGAVVAGGFSGTMAWLDATGQPAPGSESLASGDQDVFIARWDDAGDFTWQTRCGTPAKASKATPQPVPEYATALRVGASGRIYVAGSLGEGGSCTHDPDLAPTRSTGFVAAIDPSPTGPRWRWHQSIGLRPMMDPQSPTPDELQVGAAFSALALDSEENVVVVGTASRTIALGGQVAEELFPASPGTDSDPDYVDGDMIAAKLTCDGEAAWLRRYGGSYYGDNLRGVAVADDDSLHAAGVYFEEEVQVGKFTLAAPSHVCGGLDTEAALIHLAP